MGPQLMAHNKRKEKARIAARVRRSQEASIIFEMAHELLITREKLRRIDKTTIVKLAIDYIRAYEVLCKCNYRYSTTRQVSNTTTSATSDDGELTKTSMNIKAGDEREPFEQDFSLDRFQLPQAKQFELQELHDSTVKYQGNQEKCYTDNRENSQIKISTESIFAPKTNDMDSHYLMISERGEKSSFVLKPETEISEEDDLTHLAPQAGEICVSLDYYDTIPNDIFEPEKLKDWA